MNLHGMSLQRRLLLLPLAAAAIGVAACAGVTTTPPSASRTLPTSSSVASQTASMLSSGRAVAVRGDPARSRAAGSGQRTDIADVRAHLTFDPKLPTNTDGLVLKDLRTLEAGNRTSQAASDGKPGDNGFEARYEGDLRIVEVQWSTASLPDEATFGQRLTVNFPAPERFVRTTKVNGMTVWMWDHVTLPESTDSQGKFMPGFDNGGAQVSWFKDGITYVVGSPSLTAEELLAIAKTMMQ